MDYLSVVVPAYNEEKRIENSLSIYLNYFLKLYKDFEIIVVAHGCTDKTAEIIKKFKNKKVKLIEIKKNLGKGGLGKGGAVILGLRHAKGDIIGFLDADNSFKIEDVQEKLINNLKYADAVIASKWKNHTFSQVTEPFFRKFFSRGWNHLVRILFGLDFSDSQAGAKFFKKKVINAIDLNFRCTTFEFDIELLWKIKKAGFKIREEYLVTEHKEDSKFKNKDLWYMFINFIKLRFFL